MGRKRGSAKSKPRSRKRDRPRDTDVQQSDQPLAVSGQANNQQPVAQPAQASQASDGQCKTAVTPVATDEVKQEDFFSSLYSASLSERPSVTPTATDDATRVSPLSSLSSHSLSQQLLSLPVPKCDEVKSESCQPGHDDVASPTQSTTTDQTTSNTHLTSTDGHGQVERTTSVPNGHLSDPSEKNYNSDPVECSIDTDRDDDEKKTHSDPSDQFMDVDQDDDDEQKVNSDSAHDNADRGSAMFGCDWGRDVDESDPSIRGWGPSTPHDDDDKDFTSWGRDDNEHDSECFTWTRVRSKKNRKKKRSRRVKRHNPACLILDFKSGVTADQVQHRIWAIIKKNTNLRVDYMSVLPRGGLLLRFRSESARVQAERLIKESPLWQRIGRKQYWTKKKSFQVRVRGMNRRHCHALQQHPAVDQVKSIGFGRTIISYKSIEAAAWVVKNGVQVDGMTYGASPYTTAPKIGCRQCGSLHHTKCNKKKCYRCGSDDHLAKDCDNDVEVCLFCKEQGHLMQKCSKRLERQTNAAKQKRRTYADALRMSSQSKPECLRMTLNQRPAQHEEEKQESVQVDESESSPVDDSVSRVDAHIDDVNSTNNQNKQNKQHKRRRRRRRRRKNKHNESSDQDVQSSPMTSVAVESATVQLTQLVIAKVMSKLLVKFGIDVGEDEIKTMTATCWQEVVDHQDTPDDNTNEMVLDLTDDVSGVEGDYMDYEECKEIDNVNDKDADQSESKNDNINDDDNDDDDEDIDIVYEVPAQYQIPPGYDVDKQLRKKQLKIAVQAVGDALLLNRPEVMRQGFFLHKVAKSMSLRELLMHYSKSATWEDFCKSDPNAELILAQVVHTYEERKPQVAPDMVLDTSDQEQVDETRQLIQERGLSLMCECEMEYDGSKDFEEHIHNESCELMCHCGSVRFEDLTQFNTHLLECNPRVKRARKSEVASRQ